MPCLVERCVRVRGLAGHVILYVRKALMVSGIESNSDRSRVVDGIMDPMRRRGRCRKGVRRSIGVVTVLVVR